MRVLLTNHSPFHGSGSGTYTYDLAAGLQAAGHDVRCMIVDRDRGGGELFPVHRLVMRAGDSEADLPFDFPCFTSHPYSRQTFEALTDRQFEAYREANRRVLDKVIADFDPHIVHAQHVWLQGHLALEAGVPYVVTCQGTELAASRADPRYRTLAQEAAENAGRVIVPTNHLRDGVLATFGDLDGRVVTIPSAVDPAPFQPPRPTTQQAAARLGLQHVSGAVIAYAGNLVSFKGVDTLLDAAAQYEQLPQKPWTILAGDGPERDALQEQARRLGLQRVVFLGDRGKIDCAALYALADVVVLPSRGEPFGLVALEAMASATPVISSRAGGLAEIITDATGALFDVDDAQQLASLVGRALDENWKQTKGPAAAEYIARAHNPRQWVDSIVATFRAALADRFGPSYNVD